MFDKKSMFEEQMEVHGLNAILELQPDTWKNIAPPVINALKLMIDCQNKTHKKLFDTQILLEETGQRQQASLFRLQKEQERTTLRIDQSFRVLEQNTTKSIDMIRDQGQLAVATQEREF
jgi:hypothetical protein